MPTKTKQVLSEEVPLADAAFQLGVTYPTSRDMLLRGDLKGGKRDGHWFVEVASIAAFEARVAIAAGAA